MSLTLNIATPDGVALSYTNIDRAVLQRAGARSRLRSDLVLTAPQRHLKASLPAQIMRIRAGGNVIHVEIDRGFVQAQNDAITVLTQRARVVAVDQAVCPVAS